jgi:hypothetical protein
MYVKAIPVTGRGGLKGCEMLRIPHCLDIRLIQCEFATFTYIGTETRIISNLFKNTNIHIAYRTKNTIQHHLQQKNNTTDIYNMSGIYQMNCKDCALKYIGQTGRNLRTRYKEHIHAIRTNNPNSKYAQHTYSNIHETMDILHFEKKGPLMNTLEQFHIYSYNLWKENLHLNDIYTDIHNPILNTIINHYK